MPANEESGTLLKICNQQVQCQDDVLIVAQPCLVVASPSDHAQKNDCNDDYAAADRDCRESGEWYYAMPVIGTERWLAVRWREVFLSIDGDQRTVGSDILITVGHAEEGQEVPIHISRAQGQRVVDLRIENQRRTGGVAPC